MKLFGWSPLVEDAFKTNQPLFTLSRKLPPPTPELQYPPIPGLLALHVRRGDFEGHCTLLVSWKVPFSGLNNQPGTIDKDVQLVENEDGSLSQASRDALQRACYPDTDQIVERVRQIRETEEGKKLRNVFIMTNGSPEWVQELEEALMKDHKWEQIASSLQMHVSWEQKFVAQAVDMMIGHRSDVFIGNGVNLPLGLLLFFIAHSLVSFLNPSSSRVLPGSSSRSASQAASRLGVKGSGREMASLLPLETCLLIASITSYTQRSHHSAR